VSTLGSTLGSLHVDDVLGRMLKDSRSLVNSSGAKKVERLTRIGCGLASLRLPAFPSA